MFPRLVTLGVATVGTVALATTLATTATATTPTTNRTITPHSPTPPTTATPTAPPPPAAGDLPGQGGRAPLPDCVQHSVTSTDALNTLHIRNRCDRTVLIRVLIGDPPLFHCRAFERNQGLSLTWVGSPKVTLDEVTDCRRGRPDGLTR